LDRAAPSDKRSSPSGYRSTKPRRALRPSALTHLSKRFAYPNEFRTQADVVILSKHPRKTVITLALLSSALSTTRKLFRLHFNNSFLKTKHASRSAVPMCPCFGVVVVLIHP